jgi:biopolymer transport protein ExbD
MAVSLAGAAGSRRFALNQNHEINVTPFVDVMLVLLIVMMVAAPVATLAIKLDIPPAVKGTTPHNPPTVVSVGNDGRLWVSFATGQTTALQRSASLEGLPALVASSIGSSHPTGDEVMVRADSHVKYGQFVAVMNRLQQSGYYRVGLISETPRP